MVGLRIFCLCTVHLGSLSNAHFDFDQSVNGAAVDLAPSVVSLGTPFAAAAACPQRITTWVLASFSAERGADARGKPGGSHRNEGKSPIAVTFNSGLSL